MTSGEHISAGPTEASRVCVSGANSVASIRTLLGFSFYNDHIRWKSFQRSASFYFLWGVDIISIDLPVEGISWRKSTIYRCTSFNLLVLQNTHQITISRHRNTIPFPHSTFGTALGGSPRTSPRQALESSPKSDNRYIS